jgi:phage gpG-like protein
VKITVRGVAELAAKCRDMAARARDITPALTVGALDVKALVSDGFRKSFDPATGKPWQPLAAATIAQRRQNSSKPLVDTGTLSRSIETRASGTTITVGTIVPYAGKHQVGTDRIPQRRFLPTIDGTYYGGQPGSPAAKTLERIGQRVLNYVATGKPTAKAVK